MSLISGTKTDDGLRVAGQRGEPVSSGARPSYRTLGDPDGGDQGVRVHSGGWRREQEQTWEFVTEENVYGERQEVPPHSRLAEGWCKDGKISSHTRRPRAPSSERVDTYFSQLVPPLLSLSKISTQQPPCAGEKKTLKFVCCSQIWEIWISKMAYNFGLNIKWFVRGENCAPSEPFVATLSNLSKYSN